LRHATPAVAQEEKEKDKDNKRLESITVTGNKRVEKLEHVPLAISVLTEEMIERNNVRDIQDVINLSPALSITYGTTPATQRHQHARHRHERRSASASRRTSR